MSLENKFKGLICTSLLSASVLLGCEKNESPVVNPNVQQTEQPVIISNR